MQAEVTGKLKQHFNNALPKQNSTTTGVSVIMVSGSVTHGAVHLESCNVRPGCSASIEAFKVPQAFPTWKLAPSTFLLSLQGWLGTKSAPIWLSQALSPGVGSGSGTSEARLMVPGAEEPLASPGLCAILGSCLCTLFWRGLNPAGIYSKTVTPCLLKAAKIHYLRYELFFGI